MRFARLTFAALAATAMMLGETAAVEAQGRGGRHGLHVPPGHMPAPGDCRVWYMGRPPGHQPPAVPCGLLRGYRFPGAVVIGAPLHAGGYGYWEEARDGFRFRLVMAWSPDELGGFRDRRVAMSVRFEDDDDDRGRRGKRRGRGNGRR